MTATITDFEFHSFSAGQSMFSLYLQILLNPTQSYVTNTPKVLLNFQKGLVFLSKPFQISNKLTGLGFNIYIFLSPGDQGSDYTLQTIPENFQSLSNRNCIFQTQPHLWRGLMKRHKSTSRITQAGVRRAA
ncbi:hypothetical protein V6Z12_D08G077700 [Gossypium hirsutum]